MDENAVCAYIVCNAKRARKYWFHVFGHVICKGALERLIGMGHNRVNEVLKRAEKCGTDAAVLANIRVPRRPPARRRRKDAIKQFMLEFAGMWGIQSVKKNRYYMLAVTPGDAYADFKKWWAEPGNAVGGEEPPPIKSFKAVYGNMEHMGTDIVFGDSHEHKR